jgi:FixJ family two-component response regulator
MPEEYVKYHHARYYEVLEQVVEGATNKEIAEALYISKIAQMDVGKKGRTWYHSWRENV